MYFSLFVFRFPERSKVSHLSDLMIIAGQVKQKTYKYVNIYQLHDG